MNLVLLFPEDFVSADQVRLTGRRRDHVTGVHRAAAGKELVVGLAGGKIGRGTVLRAESDAVEMRVSLGTEPPAGPDVTLILAVPRPKVLNRVIASVTSMGIKRIHLINAWKVEKSYWKSPRMSRENLREQIILGLEQARDTILPEIHLHRLFRPFVEDEFKLQGLALVAHPLARAEAPRAITQPLTLAVGPEGGFIDEEIASLARVGFVPVSLGPRILRTETAVAALLGRLL